MGQFSKEGWIALVDLVTVEVMCNLLTIQNDQGDTIIHKYFRLKDYETLTPESAIKLLQVLTSKTPELDKTFLLLTNRREENCLHSMLRSYQSDPTDRHQFSRSPPLVKFLQAVATQSVIQKLLANKNVNGESAIHTISKSFPNLLPRTLEVSGDVALVLNTMDRHDNTPIHTVARCAASVLPRLLQLIPMDTLSYIMKKTNSVGDAPLHIIAKQVAYASICRKILGMLPKEVAEQVLFVTNSLSATPLHTALAHKNQKCFEYMRESLGKEKCLSAFGVNFPPNILEAVRTNTWTAEHRNHFHEQTSASCYYISQVLGKESGGDFKQLSDEKLQSRIAEFAVTVDEGTKLTVSLYF